MIGLAERRQCFAEEIEVASNVRTSALVDALATVPRERFLPPGPWTIRGEADFQAPARQTRDADPRHLYHNVAVAIDPSRLLFNGAPGLLATAIDALALDRGRRALHIGTGTGYYTALIAHIVGEAGRVVGLEVDDALARQARTNLAAQPWIDVRHADGTGHLDGPFDAMLVNAGVTHLQATWLEALADGGRIVFPLTATTPAMTTIGKGFLVLASRTSDRHTMTARIITFVAIYSGLGLRDEALNAQLGAAMTQSPYPPVKRIRLDPHDPSASCWHHASTACLSLA